VAYWRHVFVPRLGDVVDFLGPVAGARKRRLLAAARCLVVPGCAPEASSLPALEALAAGTPVVARPVGALSEIVEHGRSGFLADDVAGLADAIVRAPEVDHDACRAAVRERHSESLMVDGYLRLYERLARERAAWAPITRSAADGAPRSG
jgi:glycosyltransferase involved in cell wall biosynthesis